MKEQTYAASENISQQVSKNKKKFIIVMEKDGETIVINGKRNNIYELPLEGLAIVIEKVNLNLIEKFKEFKNAVEEGKFSRRFSFVGLALSLLSFATTGNWKLLVSAVSISFATAALVSLIKNTAKKKRIKKEIKKYDDINDCVGLAYIARMFAGEERGNSVEILENSAQLKRDAVREIYGDNITTLGE